MKHPIWKMRFILILFLIYSPFTRGDPNHIFSTSFAPVAWVNGDIDENEVASDRYNRFDLDPGRAISFRWTSIDIPFYIDYSRIDTESEQNVVERRKFQSLSLGSSLYEEKYVDGTIDYYYGISAGIGVARFDIDRVEYKATAEIGVEGGAILARNISIGLGFKYLEAGYPSETIARAFFPNINLAFRF